MERAARPGRPAPSNYDWPSVYCTQTTYRNTDPPPAGAPAPAGPVTTGTDCLTSRARGAGVRK
jgi:hypothetical protein